MSIRALVFGFQSSDLPLTIISAQGSWIAVSLSADGSNIFAPHFNDNVFTTANYGTTWINRGDPSQGINGWTGCASSADGSHLALVSANGGTLGLRVSADFGATWTTPNAPLGNWRAACMSDSGQKMLAIGDGGTFVSNDYGATWAFTFSHSNSGKAAADCSADGSKMVACFGIYGAYRSTDSGVTWSQLPLPYGDYYSIASSADGTKLAACACSGYIYVSTDSGTTWIQRGASDQWTSISMSADGSKIVAAARNGRLHKSLDSGATWTPVSSVAGWTCVNVSADGNWVAATTYPGYVHIARL